MKTLILIGSILFLVGCSGVADRQVQLDTLELDVLELFDQGDLEVSHKELLTDLLDFSKGRKQWINSRENKVELLTNDSLTVDSLKFIILRNRLFAAYKKIGVTYEQLMDEADRLDAEKRKFKEKIDLVFSEISIECQALQEETEQKIAIENALIDSINSLVSVRIVEKKWVRKEGARMFSVKIVKEAKGTEIDEVDFNLRFWTKKSNRRLGRLLLESNVPFSSGIVSYYFVEQQLHGEVFEELQGFRASELRVDVQAHRVKTGEDEITAFDQHRATENKEFSLKDPELGSCAYMTNEHPLKQKTRKMDQEFEELQKKITPNLSTFYIEILGEVHPIHN